MPTLKNSFEIFGWVLENNKGIEHAPATDSVELVQFVKPSEEYVVWDEMLNRAKSKEALYTQSVAEEFLEKSKTIPEDWKEYTLLFPGTVWRSRTNHLHCPVLVWRNNEWKLDMQWFLYDFHHETRLIVTK